MRIIAIANQKGGCGKTTVSINVAACLARENQRTLLIDLDPQGHCALGLAVPEEQIETSIADILSADESQPVGDLGRVTWQISSNFDLIPSKTDLSKLERALAGVHDRERRLVRAIEPLRERYDFVVLDTPPVIGFLTESALYAADEVIVPVDTGYFSLHGLSKQMETIRELRTRWEKPLTLRILANHYDVRTKLAREILAELRKRHGDAMFGTFINFNTKLKESSSLGQPITEYDPGSSGCRDFVRFARELIALKFPVQATGESAAATEATAETPNPTETMAPVMDRVTETFSPASVVFAQPPVLPPSSVSSPSAGLSHASEQRAGAGSPSPMAAPITLGGRPEPVSVVPAAPVNTANGTLYLREPARNETIPPMHPDDRQLLARADALAADASKLLATTQTLIGPGRMFGSGAQRSADPTAAMVAPTPPTPAQTARKIERIYGPQPLEDGVLFVFQGRGARRVQLAGDFNGWNPDRTPLQHIDDDTFQIKVPLGPGRYQYRYVVDGNWRNDPANHRVETNPFGDLNNVVEVGHLVPA